MSSIGRGRGYAGRHHVRDETPRPGDVPLPPSPASLPTDTVEVNGRVPEAQMKPPEVNKMAPCDRDSSLETDDEKALSELLLVEERYMPVVVLLEQFSPGEDGIVFNRKLKDLEAALTALCQDDNELLSAFSSLRGAALANASTARKLASVGASFTRQQRQNVLRKALLNIMESTFSKLDVLERSNPQILTNAATLMGDYFTEARLSNGKKVHLLCKPLLQYMRSLLASDDRRAHRALATQLLQNGPELLTTNGAELEDLSINIRRRILTSPPWSAIWLLLSADLCINRFQPLPAGLQTFYASNLDLLPDTENKAYSEVQYGSWKRDEDGACDKEVERGVQHMTLASEDGSVRKLRPILGAGARQNTSLSESSPSSQLPVVSPPRDSPEMWNKSSLAKRYDLNSWRQEHNEDDGQDDLSTTPSSDKFGTTQFVNDNYREFDPAKGFAYGPNERFSNPPPFVPEQFSTPPPFVVGAAQEKERGNKFTPPEARYVERFSSQEPARSVTADRCQQEMERGFNAQERLSFERKDSVASEKRRESVEFVPEVQASHERVLERPQAATTPGKPEKLATQSEKNFSSAERARRPPENWRKDKKDDARRNWGRQKSKESEEEDKSEDKAGFREGAGDGKFRRRDGRTKRKEEGEEGSVKPPQRRHAMEAPRGRYWDHDDRLDKDYNS